MNNHEEDISARAEAYTKETMFKLGEYKRKEFTNAYIEGYKSCLAAESQSVGGRNDFLRKLLKDFETRLRILKDKKSNKIIEGRVHEVKLAIVYLQSMVLDQLEKVSEDRMYAKEEMEKAMLFTFDNISSSYPRIEIERRVERYIESLPSGTIKKNEI